MYIRKPSFLGRVMATLLYQKRNGFLLFLRKKRRVSEKRTLCEHFWDSLIPDNFLSNEIFIIIQRNNNAVRDLAFPTIPLSPYIDNNVIHRFGKTRFQSFP
ncbi:hypothetical protein B9L19_14105 [Geobacillus thermocatenulatus]|uniref:Uncharacterized protein n=1 Tax=Geobacillus thermocatenulatus TaxID=33938 RepID=A0AA91QL09_9BACL|nr:hypothetical protein B9L19_14105 [Geobacillus thermocatenulatus]